MSGKYLRKRVLGAPQDPTMTHVDDPQAFRVGDIIQDAYGYDVICYIDENRFDNPDIRFAHLVEVTEGYALAYVQAGHGTLHDIRANDEEKHRWYRENTRFVQL